jgi:hypothetical protein
MASCSVSVLNPNADLYLLIDARNTALVFRLRDEELQLVSLATEGLSVNLHISAQCSEITNLGGELQAESKDGNVSSARQSPPNRNQTCKLAWMSRLKKTTSKSDVG